MNENEFPDGFLWGAATSSHQVEGGNVNDWSKWEDAGHVKNQERSGEAADHWNRYEEDFDLLEELNLNSYRFSIEWSRIEPEKGRFDDEAVEQYRNMLKSLKKRGITPIVTLHHFTNPVWLPPWTQKENIGYFSRYAEYVVSKLGDLVGNWCTINEPMNVVLLGYAGGFWPPQANSAVKGFRAMKNFIRVHNRSYVLIKNIYKSKGWSEPNIGIPLSLPYFTPASASNILDRTVNKTVKRFRNHYFMKRVFENVDFIGVNYYHAFHSRWNSIKSFTWVDDPALDLPKNDMGWNLEPEGLYHVVSEVYRSYRLPIIVTENGIADSRDRLRKWYIMEHLSWLKKAIDEGADVRGYMHWSLIDNFEWAEGFSPKFGLVAVNFDTQKRTVRESAWTYADIAMANALPEDTKAGKP